MLTYEIDGERSSVALRFRPDQPDLTARVVAITGALALDSPDGNPANPTPTDRGSVITGNLVLTLADSRTVRATVDGTTSNGSAALSIEVTVDGIDTPTRLTASARSEPDPGGGPGRDDPGEVGRLLLSGDAVIDPKVFGILRPPFLNLLLHVRWRLVLTPS